MTDIRLLSQRDEDVYNRLLEETSSYLNNELFWLPVSEISRAHFFDPEWTCIIG